MNLKDLLPRPNERMMIVGHTGSGKTTLAKAILRAGEYDRILIIDSKCTYGGPEGEVGYELARSPRELAKMGQRHERIQFRPSPAHQDVSAYDRVYEWAYRQKGIVVYTDETYLTMRGTKSPDWQRACITCGRELGIGMIMGTQRPRGIDPRVRTEADVKAQFRLDDDDDKLVFWGRRLGYSLPNPDGYAFWFRRPGMKVPEYSVLNLKGGE